MSHQRHLGGLTAMPRRMVQPVVIHVSWESWTECSKGDGEKKDEQRHYKHFQRCDPVCFQELLSVGIYIIYTYIIYSKRTLRF